MIKVIDTSENNVFRVKTMFPAKTYFVKLDYAEDASMARKKLCDFIVELEKKCTVSSVSIVNADGTFSRYAYRNSAEYAKAKEDAGKKKSVTERIHAILDDSDYDRMEKHLEAIGDNIREQAATDDEAPEDVARAVMEAYIKNDASDMLIAITGWSMNSLLF